MPDFKSDIEERQGLVGETEAKLLDLFRDRRTIEEDARADVQDLLFQLAQASRDYSQSKLGELMDAIKKLIGSKEMFYDAKLGSTLVDALNKVAGQLAEVAKQPPPQINIDNAAVLQFARVIQEQNRQVLDLITGALSKPVEQKDYEGVLTRAMEIINANTNYLRSGLQQKDYGAQLTQIATAIGDKKTITGKISNVRRDRDGLFESADITITKQ